MKAVEPPASTAELWGEEGKLSWEATCVFQIQSINSWLYVISQSFQKLSSSQGQGLTVFLTMSFAKQELKPAQAASGCSSTHIDHEGRHPIASFQLEDGTGRWRSVVKMRFIMAADAVVHHLQVLAVRMLHIETCQHGNLLVQPANGGLCRALQPRTRSTAYCYDYNWTNILLHVLSADVQQMYLNQS